MRDHFLKKHNLHLLPAELFLIVAIHAPEGTGIHDIVTKSIIAGERGGPYRRVGETRLLDRISSPKGVAVADLAKEVWTGFGVRLGVDFCVIEVLFRLAQVKGMPTTFEELAVYDWSQVYGTYFALHQPSDVLKKRIEYKKMLDLAIWILQEFMETRHGIPPSEFYRDYVQDHPLLSDLIRDALAQYRWCPDYQG